MTREAVVEPGAFGPLAAILEDGRLVLFLDPPLPGEAVTDALFLARVVRVEPRMNAAFLDLGDGLEGFATAKDLRRGAGSDRPLPVERLVREGERLIVQGVREADEDKRARFTTDVRLFGLFLVHRPLATETDVSGRARGRLREELRERARHLFPEGGFVLRRHAAAVDDRVLREEAARLAARWREIRRQATERRAPGPLAGTGDAFEEFLRIFLDEEVRRVVVADAALAARLRGLLDRLPAKLRPELRRLPDGGDAFAGSGVLAQLDEALAPVVRLPGGGRIVIEPTLACVAIDVDGEGRAALDIDLEAAAEIGRQVRLRNLGGSIVVDFLDLTRPGDRRRLEDALKSAFRDDPAQVQVHGMSPLGIVQISRARRGRPLAARWRRPCRCCGTAGREPSLEARIEELFRDIRSRAQPPRRVRVGDELAARLRQLALPWTEGLDLLADPQLAPDGFVAETVG
jgi:Rne/Rng family ribonuclease